MTTGKRESERKPWERVIKTDFVHPPIPDRQFDWCAWYDGDEEKGEYGYGKTEAEAKENLLEEYPEEGGPT